MTDLIKELNKYNIRARDYKKAPFGPGVFALTMKPDHPEGTILAHQGTATVKVHGSKRLRQAAVTVRERGRKITRTLTSTWLNRENPPNEEEIGKMLKQRFPVVMPKNTTWKVTDTSISKKDRSYASQVFPNRYTWSIRGKVTASVENNTINHFLMGMDETHNFIAALPKEAKTVKEAHKLLRPKISRRSLRQGEWFFVPVSKAQQHALNRRAAKTAIIRLATASLGKTTHTARSAIRVGSNIFARGYITDQRAGHHRSLFLPTWHEVVHNKETEIKVSADQQSAALTRRRMRSWD